MDDATLLRNYVETGSDQAFEQLVARHFNLVYGSALRVVGGDAHLAQDVAQHVFTDLARKARRLPQGLLLGGWLYKHTCFTAANAVRTERRREHRERQAAAMTNHSQDADAVRLQLAPILDEAMSHLKTADRDAIVLRFFERRPFQAVGGALGTSEEAARKRVERALEKMRGFLVARGISVSSIVLSGALETRAAGAAPAGLSNVVATAALAGAAKSGGSGLFLIKLMTMTKTQIALAGLLAGVAAAFLLQSHLHPRAKAPAAGQALPPGEVANITLNFPGIPVEQIFSLYATTAKEKLRVPANLSRGGIVRVKTSHALTKTEALKLLDAVLLEQAQITITRSTDGTLVAIPKQKIGGRPAVKDATRTYLPDGQVDPPFPPAPGMRVLPLAPKPFKP